MTMALEGRNPIIGSSAVCIVEQPALKQVVRGGQSVTMSIATEGTPHRSEWQCLRNPEQGWCSVTGPRFEGIDSVTLTVHSVQRCDEGSYRCVVYSQAQDQEPRVSKVSTLSVVSPPVVCSPAKGKEVVVVGADATLSVEAEGGGDTLHYQWQWAPSQQPQEREQREGIEGAISDSANSPDPDAILERFYPNLSKHFHVQSAFPNLRQYGLITGEQQEKLMLPINTNLDRVDYLMVWLPKVGPGYLDKFILCLRESSHMCPIHSDIADEIESALGRPKADSAESSREKETQSDSASEKWVDLSENNRFRGSKEPRLRVISVCGEDAGSYRCLVSNDAGTVTSCPVELVIADAPKIVGDLKDVKATLHGQVALKVSVVGEGSLNYTWQKKAENSTEWQTVTAGGKCQGQGTPSLTLAGMEETDEGLFRCQVTSEGGRTFTKEALLRIESLIQVQLHPVDTTVIASQDLTLSVGASCTEPLTYTWQKKITESKKEQWDPVSTDPSNTTDALLTISGVSESDAGMYRCVVRSKTGMSAISQPASVTVISIDQVVTRFVEDCKSAEDVDEVVGLFVKTHGKNSEVTKSVLLTLVQLETDHHKILKAMLDFSVCTDVQKDGFTLLHLACVNRHAQSVKLLLESGVDKNPSSDVRTPLHLAAERGHCNIVDLLLKSSTDSKFINSKDKMGRTALHSVIEAIRTCSMEDEQMMELTETVRLLVDSKARIDVQDLHLQTPLHLAAASGHPHIVYFLLNTDHDRHSVSFADEGKNTALHVACAERNLDCATAILDYPEGSLIINSQNEDGNSPLHLAYGGGFDEIVEMLLQRGANKTLTNQAGKTPDKTMNSARVPDYEHQFKHSPSLKRGIRRQPSVDASSPKGKKEKKRETTTRPVLSINPEGSLSSVDDDCTSPKKPLPGKYDWRWHSISICGDGPPSPALPAYSPVTRTSSSTSDTVDEIKAMDRAMSGFKGTLPQYQNKVEAGAPLRRLVKQGPLVKFSRIRKSPRFIFLFSDVLVLTEELGRGRYQFKQAMPIHFMLVGGKSNHSDSSLCFDVFSVTRSLTLWAKSEAEKQEWLQALGKCIGEYNQMIGRNPIDSDHNLMHAPIYEPDENVTKCQLCEANFTFLRRKHHCRACGKAICNDCSLGRAMLPYKLHPTRVCNRCLSADSNAIEVEQPGVLERPACSVDSVLKRGYVRYPKTNIQMWYELEPDGVLYTYRAQKDVSAERTLPLPGYKLVVNQGDMTLKLVHHQAGDELFAFDDIGEFEQWKSALDKVLT